LGKGYNPVLVLVFYSQTLGDVGCGCHFIGC
jgi:hypothetical protein